ncbi:DUF547 domain-containing protein [Salisaeta longa]|uniref:DUF547 domain-containing protein n=1 Tax=Salisaeta longa TaxID=503170 RepID=UPI0003B5D74E|nr:DUF547 domain-containing protein [Salisaeta longa]
MQQINHGVPESADALYAILMMLLFGWTSSGGAFGQPAPAVGRPATTIDHAPFTRLLQAYVDSSGRVDYAGLRQVQQTTLAPYLQVLARADTSHMSRAQQLAFWINAYNALTLRLVLRHYPITSLRDLPPSNTAGRTHGPFERTVGRVAGAPRSLNEIEHGIIRTRFSEPRIHFALVCAAMSCPPLRRRAYTAARLDAQLAAQAQRFLRDSTKNRIPRPSVSDTLQLSKLFLWFQEDFGGSPAAVQRFLAPYMRGPRRAALRKARYTVTYRPYDWSLNDWAHDRARRQMP